MNQARHAGLHFVVGPTMCLVVLLGVAACAVGHAAPAALLVVGLSADENACELQSLAAESKRLLIERGFPRDRVVLLNAKVSGAQVLQNLHAVAATTTTNDEFWLVLYGISGRSRGNQPAFQVSGPRLTAADLKQALDAIPALQFVLIGTGNGGGFLPVLQGNRRTVLSATREEGEPDLPRFPDAWLQVLRKNPKAPFVTLAAQAAALVDAQYTQNHLAQSEHSQLADPATGRILEPPFGLNLDSTNQALSSFNPK
jgi:hypothetical protein